MKKFTMTAEQYARLVDASKPVPMIALQCGPPPSQQDAANLVWMQLGKEMGFEWNSARPIQGESDLHFVAKPIEVAP